MDNYVEGDKICLFGFSRGAYVARSLAGMLEQVGGRYRTYLIDLLVTRSNIGRFVVQGE